MRIGPLLIARVKRAEMPSGLAFDIPLDLDYGIVEGRTAFTAESLIESLERGERQALDMSSPTVAWTIAGLRGGLQDAADEVRRRMPVELRRIDE